MIRIASILFFSLLHASGGCAYKPCPDGATLKGHAPPTGLKQGCVKDRKPHGTLTAWYENGQMKEQAQWNSGVQDGKTTHWYESGQMKQKVQHKDGKQHGKTTLWYENGQVKEDTEYKDGSRHGRATHWYESGQMKG